MQGAENDSELLQNSAIFGGSVLHGEPVTLRPSEESLQQLIGPSQGHGFGGAGPNYQGESGTGPGFGNGGSGMQMKSDPASAMPPIQLPPGFPNWPSTSSGAGGQQLNGFNNGQHHAANIHGASNSLPNGGHNSAPGPSHVRHNSDASSSGVGAAASSMAGIRQGTGGPNKSRYRGVSYDKKKRKWRVQIKVATLGKSGVSVGYYDTEEAAARAYDRAAIGLLGRNHSAITTNFPLHEYDKEPVPQLIGKTREEVKATLKSERAKVPRRRFSSRQRTSRFMGVGSSNRKNQWQARILVHGKVTHLGYYETEEEAARVYDRVSISLHGAHAQTNYPVSEYEGQDCGEFQGLAREELQRALGVKPMDKSSQYRGVSKKKGKWEAKVMVNRKWAYRELFDSEEEAARAYDDAVWRLKPKEAKSYINFKERYSAERMRTTGKPRSARQLHQRGSQHSSDSPHGAASSPSASMGSGGNGNGSGIGRSLPPLAPPSPGEVAMASGSGGRMLRASDLVRANSTASTEEPALMRRHSSSTGGLPSSLLQGFGNTRAPSPASSEEALFRGHLMGVPLPGQGGRTGSPVSSTDDALARANGLPGLLPPQAQDSATSKNALPKSASTSHLGTLKQMPPGPMNMGYFPDGSFIPLGVPEEGQPSAYQPGQMPHGLRMLRTMSTPHIAMSQGSPMQPGMVPYDMYSMGNPSAPGQGAFMMPPSSSYAASSMPYGAMPGGFDAPPGVMRMRHSVSAIDLPQSGGMQGAGNFQQQQSFPMYGLGAPMAPLTDLQHLSSPRASQAAAQMGSGGMMVRVGSEQHLISDHPQQHMGRTPSDASYPGLTGSPSHRPYSPGGGMPSPLIGGLNSSLGSRTQSGLSAGEAGTPRSRSGLPPHPLSPVASPGRQGRPQLPPHSAPHQQFPADMQVDAASGENPFTTGTMQQQQQQQQQQLPDQGQHQMPQLPQNTPMTFTMVMPGSMSAQDERMGGMPRSLSSSHLPMQYRSPGIIQFSGGMASIPPAQWMGAGQSMGQDGSAGAAAAPSWRCDYNLPSGQLTGMGQRSASASNLAAMNLPPGEWFGAQDQLQNGASLVKSASVSSLGHLCTQYRAQPFTARLPTLHADKPSDGLGPDPTPNSLDANTSLLDELAESAMVTDGNGMEGCPSPLRAVQIGGEDLTMFDGTNPPDGSEFLLDPDLTPDDA
ncbi:probable AP2-like ethylene-responsive transcription factor PLT2 at N-terminal half [Coccomyxa sp. Obi]|nr:probable AP2-like ethylene-responsive transcription factor PLT2 at N-terminal half [Coccomyxa sp. Obi]